MTRLLHDKHVSEYTLDDLRKFFHLPCNKTAARLGIGQTAFQRICRANGIKRWPFRQYSSLLKSIEKLKRALNNSTSPTEKDHYARELTIYESALNKILSNPNYNCHDLMNKIGKQIKDLPSIEANSNQLASNQYAPSPLENTLPSLYTFVENILSSVETPGKNVVLPSWRNTTSSPSGHYFSFWNKLAPIRNIPPLYTYTLYVVEKAPEECPNNAFFYVQNNCKKFVLFVKDGDYKEVLIEDFDHFDSSLKKIPPIAKNIYELDEKSIDLLFTKNGEFSIANLSRESTDSSNLFFAKI